MPRGAPPPAGLADSPDELEARFYEALQRGDLEALMALWADDDEVMCVHPGGPRVVGLGAIRSSFETIFANGGIPVAPEQVHRLHWAGGAVHHLLERISVNTGQGVQTGWVQTTNVYVKGSLGWQMVAHHASPAAPGGVRAASAGTGLGSGAEPASTLH